MTRNVCRALWLVLLACLTAACAVDPEYVAATQVTVRIYASQEVHKRMAQLRLRSYREDLGSYRFRAERSYDKRELGNVVDLILSPSQDGFEGTLLVIVDAIDEDGLILVQTRATFEFLTAEKRLIELWLYPCELKQLGELCSDADCEGDACLTCVDNRCAPTPSYTPSPFVTSAPATAKPPDWLNAGTDAGAADACSGESCQDPLEDAGADAEAPQPDAAVDAGVAPIDAGSNTGTQANPDSGSDAVRDSGSDANVDAGANTGLDAGFDAGRDPGSDAGSDAGRDAGPAVNEAGTPDTGTPDTGTPLEPPGRCAASAAWAAVAPFGAIPAGARVLAAHTTSDRGSLPQYICRVVTPDGSNTPAKVSQDPNNSTRFDFGCFAAYFDAGSATWREYGNTDVSSRFEVLTAPSECVLDWVSVPVNGALPARALAIGSTNAGAPLYSCRVQVNTTSGGVTRMGTHMGRISASAGDLCRVQYYSVVEQRNTFEVLVQTRP